MRVCLFFCIIMCMCVCVCVIRGLAREKNLQTSGAEVGSEVGPEGKKREVAVCIGVCMSGGTRGWGSVRPLSARASRSTSCTM